MTCLTCKRVANAFDPYLSVCLPIVKEEKLEFNFVGVGSHDLVTKDGEESYELRPFTVVETLVSKSMRV